MQSEFYSGPIKLTDYERFQQIRESLANEGVKIPRKTDAN
jgi:arylsulfatase